jgi:hypothetical protein
MREKFRQARHKEVGMDEQMSLGVSGKCEYLDAKDLAHLLKLSVQRVYQLERETLRDGVVFEKTSQGYHIENIRRYQDYKDLNTCKSARTQLDEIRVIEKQMDLDERQKNLVRYSDIKNALLPAIQAAVQRVQDVPKTQAPFWFKADSPIHLATMAQKDIDGALEEIANGVFALASVSSNHENVETGDHYA